MSGKFNTRFAYMLGMFDSGAILQIKTMHAARIALVALSVSTLPNLGCTRNDVDSESNPNERSLVGDAPGDPNGFEHIWAIDVAKVREKLGATVNAVSLTREQVGAPEAAWSVACETAKVVNNGQVSDGDCMFWSQMQRRNFDHGVHKDDPVGHPVITLIDGDKRIDPPGYLNIIALKKKKRHEQDEVRRYLRNGDILVYFHPDGSNTTELQMSHAAMYYDTGQGPLAISLSGTPYVHHIDNPTSYGPPFNAGVSGAPFHVFRFSPNGAPGVGPRDDKGRFRFSCTDEIRDVGGPSECQRGESTFVITDEMADHYAYMARNWALITNGHAPFSDFHSFSWRDAGQRGKLATGVLDDVNRFAAPVLEGGETPPVYCAGLVFTNLNLAMNRPLNQRALGTELWSKFSSAVFNFDDYYMKKTLQAADLKDQWDLPKLGQLVEDPWAPTDLIDFFIEKAFRRLPREARAQVIGAMAPQLVSSFYNLTWAPGKPSTEALATVATEERVKLYARAYGLGGQALAEFKQKERDAIANRYIPPFAFYDIANREDGKLSYVGTVLHIDLLKSISGAAIDTGSGDETEYTEGGPDTSLYPNFTIPNGQRKVQRLLDVSSGPWEIGPGTQVITRLSAADIRDVRIVIHPPDTFTRLPDRWACNNNRSCVGDAPSIAVTLQPGLNNGTTAWVDVPITLDFFKPISEGGLGCTIENGEGSCPQYDWATGQADPSRRLRLGTPRGQWTVTVLDRGALTEGHDVPNCDECRAGGAHSNQWILKVRNDAASTVTSPNCDDIPPPGGFTCEQQRGWNKCIDSWMIDGGFCRQTCGRCPGQDAENSATTGDLSTTAAGRVDNGGVRAFFVTIPEDGPGLSKAHYGTTIKVRLSAAPSANQGDLSIYALPPGTFRRVRDTIACADGSCLKDAPALRANVGYDAWTYATSNLEVPLKLFAYGYGFGCSDSSNSASCSRTEWTSDSQAEELRGLPQARGQWAIIVADKGSVATGADIANCPACSAGGAQVHQVTVTTRYRAVASCEDRPPPGFTECAYSTYDQMCSVPENNDRAFFHTVLQNDYCTKLCGRCEY